MKRSGREEDGRRVATPPHAPRTERRRNAPAECRARGLGRRRGREPDVRLARGSGWFASSASA
eukprot:7998-Chlamydomonas_euryale.AAC.4